MRRVVADVPWSVYLFICLLDITVSCAKTDELIEMSFGMSTRVGLRNHVLGGDPGPRREKGNFGGTPAMRLFIKFFV